MGGFRVGGGDTGPGRDVFMFVFVDDGVEEDEAPMASTIVSKTYKNVVDILTRYGS
jgi:hypothetical protein